MSSVHVIFDLDDTLYPERHFAVAGFRAAGRWAEAEFGVKGIDLEMIDLLDRGMLGKIFATVLSRHVPDHTPDQVAAFHNAYRTCEPDLSLFDDARHALDHFGGLGPIGLITDGMLTMQQRKVRALALEPRFAHIVYTDALGPDRAYFKPHARPFETMAAALGRAGDRYVYVGDNPAKDFIAPNALGWTTVQVVRSTRGIHDATHRVPGGDAHYRVDSLRDLGDILAQAAKSNPRGPPM